MNQTPSNQPRDYPDYNDDIDLADYMTVLIKRKWFILIGTVLCFCIGLFYASIKKSPFEAQASLLIVPPLRSYKTELAPPTFDVNIYRELATAQDLMQVVIDSLDLQSSDGRKLSIPALSGLLSTEVLQEEKTLYPSDAGASALMNLVVTSVDTVLWPPVKIANKWAELFVRKNSGINFQETEGSYEFIKEQYEFARDSLIAAEDSLMEFNRQNQIEIMKADLGPTSAKLTEYQANMFNSNLELSLLEETLDAQEKLLLELETPSGQWIGSLDIEGNGGLSTSSLNVDQQRVLKVTINSRNEVRRLRELVRKFEDENDLMLMAEDIGRKRSTLVFYWQELSKMQIDVPSVSQTIEELSTEGVDRLSTNLLVETLPPETLRELMSLQIGYNLLVPRQQYLIIEVARLKAEIDSLEQVFSENSLKLALLKEKLATEEQTYQNLLTQYRETKSQSSSLKLAINTLRPKVDNLVRERKKLQEKTESLNNAITRKELERTRLNRKIEMYKSTYNKFVGMFENARVAKANDPGDVKIVARAVKEVMLTSRVPIALAAACAGLVGMIFLSFLFEYIVKARERLDHEDSNTV